MGRIEEIIKKSVSDIIVVGRHHESYDIISEVKNLYNITLPPISFTDFMVGRDQEISDIQEWLKKKKMMVIINGVGGIGKTTVCKYLFKHSIERLNHTYKHIAWVDYNKNLANSFIKAFHILNIPFEVSDSPEEKFERIIFELNKLGEDLLIFIDNVDKVHQQDKGITRLLQSKNHVIVTSRVKVFDDEFLYPMGFLDDCDCEKLFLKYYQYEYEEKVKEIGRYLSGIIKLCGYHSLTVELLAKTINEENYTLKYTLSLLKQKKFDLSKFKSKVMTDWDNRQYEKDIDEHIEKVFSITRLTQAQKEILIRAAFLAPVEIEMDIVQNLLNVSRKQLETMINRGWIISDGRMIKIHQIIKRAITKQRTGSISKYRFILDNASRLMDWENIYKELDLLVPHAEEIFTEFRRSNSKFLGELAGKIAEYYKYQGDMKCSIQYMKKQVTILKRDDYNLKTVASCKKNIAALYMEIGTPETALRFLADVLHIRKHIYKPCSLELAECYANIGFAYQELGEYKKMLSNANKALSIRVKVDGDEGGITAQSHNNLAMAYALIYDFQNGMNHIDKAISIRKKKAEKAEKRKDLALLDLAQSVNIKGFILLGMGDYKEAITLLKSSMELREEYLGENNVITATAYQRYAMALCMNQQMKEAYDYIYKAIDIFRRKSGLNTIDMAVAFNTYGIICRSTENMKDAESLHMKAIRIITGLYSTHHPRLLQFYEDLAETYSHFKEEKNAMIYYRKALEVGSLFLDKHNYKLICLFEKIGESKM